MNVYRMSSCRKNTMRPLLLLLLLVAGCITGWVYHRWLNILSHYEINLILSTDISGGITGPFGGCHHCNPQLQVPGTGSPTSLIAYRPQDTDDAMAVIMALNHPDVNVMSIIPQFGNTDLATEIFIANYVTRHLKGQNNIPVVPGAVAPVLPLLIQPPELYFDNAQQGGSRILDPLQLFKLGCPNLGVHRMRQDILSAIRQSTKVFVAVLGPASDVACLFINHPEVKPGVEAVVFLGSQPADRPMRLNAGPAPPDFNVLMDPLAAAVMMYAVQGVDLVLMHWTLTSLGTTRGQNIVLDKTTIKPPNISQQQQQQQQHIPESTEWLWQVQDVRTAAGFGTKSSTSHIKSHSAGGQTDRNSTTSSSKSSTEDKPVPPGPFDQYVIQYVIDRSVFQCKKLPVYMQQCPTAPWLRNSTSNSSSSSSGRLRREPYNDPANPCPGHGVQSGDNKVFYYEEQPAMLLVDMVGRYSGPLVNGSGLLPSFDGAAARHVTVCYDYAIDAGRQRFVDSLRRWIW